MERCRIVVPRENLDVFLKARQSSRAGAREKWDWDEGRLFAMRVLEQKGNPRDKNNQTEKWKSDADLARLVADHLAALSKDGSAPDERTVRAKASVWIDEFGSGRN